MVAIRRRVELDVHVGADNRMEARTALLDAAAEVGKGSLEAYASGPWSTVIMEGTEDPTVTHESYWADLKARLDLSPDRWEIIEESFRDIRRRKVAALRKIRDEHARAMDRHRAVWDRARDIQ